MGVKKATDLVAEARARIDNLSVEQVEKEIGEGAIVVDLREAEELKANGKIPGSLHVTRGLLEFRADPSHPYHTEGLEPGKRVILHCASGGRSALAGATLKDMGYENVGHLDGGFTAWKAAGKDVDAV